MDNELRDFSNVAAVLRDFADYFHVSYEQLLIASDRVATRELLESVRTRVVENGTSYDVVVTLRDYWKYIEEDTRPHWPPPEAIQRWVEVKPTIPRPYTLNGKEISAKSLAYLVGRKIARYGTKGTHDMATAKQQTLDAFRARLKEALGHDAVNYIRKLLPRT